jgi:uncharacterized protein YaiL (DUF2058 family)
VSLRDQLVAKGIVSKKDARKVDRELKEQRRAEQGSRKRKSATEREARARAEAEAEARREERIAERRELDARREVAERALRVKNLIEGNRLKTGTGQAFWHRSLDGRLLLRLDVSSGTAWQLRSGEASIVAVERLGAVDYAVIPRRAALVLQDIAPERLVFHHPDPMAPEGPDGLDDPSLDFLRREWEPSLAAHRARPGDVDLPKG